jgi:hypothetical protein
VWFESPDTRLSRWREFRQNLNTCDIAVACLKIVKWWQSAPLANITIDPLDTSTWPTPWEMINCNDYCEHSIALGMAYTMHYANPDIECELVYLINKEKSIERLCALINKKYLLNFEQNAISIFSGSEDQIIFRKNIKEI